MNVNISVILPFYNSENTLNKAIESIINQNCEDYELLLINNNSTDNSRKIAYNYTQYNSKVKLFDQTKQGVVYASELGLQVSKGKYIARMDADDIAMPNRLKLQAQYLDKNLKIDAIAGKVSYHSEMEENTEGFQKFIKWSNSIISSEEIELYQFAEFPIVNPSLMFRKEIATKFGYYQNGNFPEDYEMFLRWLSKGVKLAKLNKIILQWTDSKTRLTRTDSLYSTENFFKIKAKYLSFWLKARKIEKIAIWGAGRKTRQRVSYLENFGIEILFFIDIVENKTSIRKCIHYNEIKLEDKIFIISYVANRNAQKKIFSFLNSKGFVMGKDFILAA